MRVLNLSILCGLTAAATAAAESIIVGKYPAKIVPEQISEIILKENGLLTDLAPAGQKLKKDDIIVIINKEQTEHDREDMELSLVRERITKQDEMRQLETKRRQAEFYLNLTEGERRYNTDFKGDDEIPTPESLKDTDDRINLLKRELETLERRKRREFDLKHTPLTVRMPFDGLLQYNVPLPENKQEIEQGFKLPENNARTFATVCDDSAYYITISLVDGEHSLLNEQDFSVSIALPEGKKIEGSFAHRKVERAGNGDALIYYFRVPQESHDTAHRMLGSRYTATLRYQVEGEVLRVSKVKLATHPKAAECEDWNQLVGHTHPDYNVLIIGTTDIVLTKKP